MSAREKRMLVSGRRAETTKRTTAQQRARRAGVKWRHRDQGLGIRRTPRKVDRRVGESERTSETQTRQSDGDVTDRVHE